MQRHPSTFMIYLNQLQEGVPAISFAQVRGKQIKLKKNGEPYASIDLGDRASEIQARVWEVTPQLKDEIQVGDFVKYRGVLEIYRGNRQLVIDRIRKVIPQDHTEGFSVEELLASTPFDIDKMWNRLVHLVEDECRRPEVRTLLQNLLDRHGEAVRTFPAGKAVHHNYRGGFLEHVLFVLESAVFFAGRYPQLDRDLLIAGAVLHDFGKLQELAGPETRAYTTRGALIGHIVLGRDMVLKEATRVSGLSPDFLMRLEHVILSHQGQLEWGSPVLPKTPEAVLLHYIDDLDAKMNRVLKVLREDPNGSEFTNFDPILGRQIYRPNEDDLDS